jgi:hypothetical protein
MAERKVIEDTSCDAVANPTVGGAEEGQAETELPAVESVSSSSATETAAEPIVGEGPADPIAAAFNEADLSAVAVASREETAPAAAPEIVAPAPTSRRRLVLRRRHRRHALLAASVAIAAALGAVIGATTTGGFSSPAAVNAPGVEENKAMQQSVVRLTKEITSLKASLEAANKSAHSQIAKISERLNRGSTEITSSITPPQTVPASAAPVPTPRPASAGAETQPPARVSVVADWSIRQARDGYVYVQGHGDIYEVVPGAPLPGLGPVEQIKRQDGRWVVVTPKGIIVSMRDRRYFEQF